MVLDFIRSQKPLFPLCSFDNWGSNCKRFHFPLLCTRKKKKKNWRTFHMPHGHYIFMFSYTLHNLKTKHTSFPNKILPKICIGMEKLSSSAVHFLMLIMSVSFCFVTKSRAQDFDNIAPLPNIEPLPALEAGAGYSLSFSGALICSSMLTSLIAFLLQWIWSFGIEVSHLFWIRKNGFVWVGDDNVWTTGYYFVLLNYGLRYLLCDLSLWNNN